MTDEDLFKPLSAKTGRKHFGPGGRELSGGRLRQLQSKTATEALRRYWARQQEKTEAAE